MYVWVHSKGKWLLWIERYQKHVFPYSSSKQNHHVFPWIQADSKHINIIIPFFSLQRHPSKFSGKFIGKLLLHWSGLSCCWCSVSSEIIRMHELGIATTFPFLLLLERCAGWSVFLLNFHLSLCQYSWRSTMSYLSCIASPRFSKLLHKSTNYCKTAGEERL